MTRSQYRVFNKLRSKQVNHNDVTVVDITDSAVVFHVRFPGLYLTYDTCGQLVLTETEAERKASGKPLLGSQIGGEVGSDTKGLNKPPEEPNDGKVPWDDDDVPF